MPKRARGEEPGEEGAEGGEQHVEGEMAGLAPGAGTLHHHGTEGKQTLRLLSNNMGCQTRLILFRQVCFSARENMGTLLNPSKACQAGRALVIKTQVLTNRG